MTELDEAFALEACGLGEWKTVADRRYEANSGMFGGWTAAILLKSVLDDARVQTTPSALTVHYLKQVPPSNEVSLRTRLVGGGRSLSFWHSELWVAGQGEPAALATIILASRRASDGFTEPSMPNAADPETLPTFNPPGTFGERTLIRPISGYPPFDRANTQSIGWVREMSGRAVDYPHLAYLADAYAPRIFYKSKGPRLSATLTMSVYFLAGEAQVREIGDDYLLSEVAGTRAEESTSGAQARLWTRTGVLLVTTEQLCWFR